MPVICHVNLARGFRGGERQTQLLITELARLGWQQRLVVRNGSALPSRVEGVDQLDVREVSANALSAAIASKGCDLLHAHEGRAIYVGLLSRLPYLLTRRIANPFKHSLLRGIAYRNATRIVALSRSIARGVQSEYPGVPVSIIPSAHANLSDGHKRNPSLARASQGKTVVGHIAAMDGTKGHENIIEVARSWEQSRPEVQFLLVGSGRKEKEYRDLAVRLSNVEFAGQVDNVDDYLDIFDIFVFPSLMEGLGSTILDAMCFGLPIVATNVGGIPDLVEDGVNGLLVNPDATDELSGALQRVLDNEALRTRFRDENLRRSGRYSASAMAKSYDALYRDILNL